jgi:hypothetical protein
LWLDNNKVHKAAAVERLLSKNSCQIRIEWLPGYTPELTRKRTSGDTYDA